MFDLSLTVKLGVQAGLFAGAVEQLGTATHHQILESALRGELLGCFAMTERGHGSDVRGLQTTATYQPQRGCFVIDTPSLSAGKEWIGNAAVDAQVAVIFAQLRTAEETHGVHAFIVPIRDHEGQPLLGIRIEDCGAKMGLNGVDNGRLWFEQVQVPREALLDRFGQVDADGRYHSAVPSAGKRFFTMLSTLVGGRIAVAGAGTMASKVGLSIALRYAVARTQFQRPDGSPKTLWEFASHRKRLLPRLAAAYAFSFAQQGLVRAASEQVSKGQPSTHDVDTLAAGIKALASWQAIDTLQQCRECCGGQGYLSSNRIDALRTDTDVFTTFEGDNTVLLSLVASNLLRQHRRSLSKAPLKTLFKSVYQDVVMALGERSLTAQRDSSPQALRSLDFHAAALRFREKSLLSSLTTRIASRVRKGMAVTAAFEECQDHALALARAHTEVFVLASFQRVAREVKELEPLCALYGLWRIDADLAWFLENDFLAPRKSRAVRDMVRELCEELASEALELVAAFGIPASCEGPLADLNYLRRSGLASASAKDDEPRSADPR